MKIALLGYGKMGKEVEKAALKRGHEIVLKIDVANPGDLSPENLSGADAAIEFTTPQTAPENIRACLNAGLPVVVGTTGWYAHFDELAALCRQREGTLFHATNFSIGVAIFFHMNRMLAGIMNAHPDYEVSIEEIHHTRKLDAPSGTAITAAEAILEQILRKEGWENAEKTSGENKLLIKSLREGDVPGTHTVTYRSGIDSIELKHTAFSREGFASGAVAAAEWVRDRKGVFTMSDMLRFN
ncbi:dihydrodipicolinate reductase [Anseongella ginsenosidimutans]|uniref:4-hydroxy-tetrahydrodipicolinate reductase n=1 Tax=Anseongella ginsenosidimutans TaxID=496056 RepID=A0A4R3KP47_9SPHI|nr:4-hydroxy-tetrahydrodipicolinate reductase [Anseongella ginsenosidimutans]QEC53980.1 4-hydroxy-tetrahydrodipicolinate reductase [Anseongella ginsenosidimutans]TCS86366.1 dihydrodipicolinate reductase [Anseongella ginsenosidimutans]